MGVVAEKTRTREQTLGILLSSLYRTEGLHTRATHSALRPCKSLSCDELMGLRAGSAGVSLRISNCEFHTAHPVNNDRVHSCSVEAAGGRDNRQGSEND